MRHETSRRGERVFLGWAKTLADVPGTGTLEQRDLFIFKAAGSTAAAAEFDRLLSGRRATASELIDGADAEDWLARQSQDEQDHFRKALGTLGEHLRQQLPAWRRPTPDTGGTWKVVERTRALKDSHGRIETLIKERLV